MPLQSVGYRDACGRYEKQSSNYISTALMQNKLNYISASQHRHVPQKCNAACMLYLSALVLPVIQRVTPGELKQENAPGGTSIMAPDAAVPPLI